MSLELAGLIAASGKIPSRVLDDALRRQVLAGGTLDTALLEAAPGFSEADCLKFLEQAAGIATADAWMIAEANPALAQLLPAKLAERHCVVPLKLVGRTLQVAVSYPVKVPMLDEIGFLLGRILQPFVALEVRVREAVNRIYGVPLPARHASLLAFLGAAGTPEGPPTHPDSAGPYAVPQVGGLRAPPARTPEDEEAELRAQQEKVDRASREAAEAAAREAATHSDAVEARRKQAELAELDLAGEAAEAPGPAAGEEPSDALAAEPEPLPAPPSQPAAPVSAPESAPASRSPPEAAPVPRQEAPPPPSDPAADGPVEVDPAPPAEPAPVALAAAASEHEELSFEVDEPSAPSEESAREEPDPFDEPKHAPSAGLQLDEEQDGLALALARALESPTVTALAAEPAEPAPAALSASGQQAAPAPVAVAEAASATPPIAAVPVEAAPPSVEAVAAPAQAANQPAEAAVRPAETTPAAEVPAAGSDVPPAETPTGPSTPAAPPEPRPTHAAPASRRAAPRDRVDVSGLVGKITAVSGGTPGTDADPIENWSLNRARAELENAEDRRQVVRVALRFALKTFDYAAALAVVGGNAVGWSALDRRGLPDERIERISVPLDVPSVLRTVLLTRGCYLGPLPDDSTSRSLVDQLTRPKPSSVFVFPVEIRDRPVVLLYGDVVGRAAADKLVSEFVVFAQHLGRRFERLVLEQKRRLATVSASAEQDTAEPPSPHAESARAVEPTPSAAPDSPDAGAPGAGEGPAAEVDAGGKPGPAQPPAAPPSIDALYAAADQLTSSELQSRVQALALLSRWPEFSAAILAARFPGPVLRARLAIGELPSPDELGPIPAALAKMGPPAARALLPLLDHRDVDTRYFALLVAGSLRVPALVGPVCQRVFDRNQVVAGVARLALSALKGLPGFDEAVEKVRASLGSRDPETAALAARALGSLHDVTAVEKLVAMTAHESKPLAQAASDALREICKQSFGGNTRRWTEWWRANAAKPRTSWVIAALRDRDLDMRISAIDELFRAFGDNFGYYADGPRQDREAAIKRWEEWWAARQSA